MGLKDAFKDKPAVEIELLPDRIEGTVLHLNKKGFGFIQSPSIPFERIYFYWLALEQDTKRFNELKKGMKLEFTPKKYEKGWRAIKVRTVE
jgi:cold shock CspA family protein